MVNEINSYNQSKIPQTFQGSTVDSIENTGSAGALKSMELPSTPDEFVRYIPYIAAGGAATYGTYKLANYLTYAKDSATVKEAFDNSRMVRWTGKFEKFLEPVTSRMGRVWGAVRPKISQYTPGFIKNIVEKIRMGVQPQWSMAKQQANGIFSMASDHLIHKLESLPAEEIEKLGLKDILREVKAGTKASHEAARIILEKIKDLPIAKGTTIFEIPRTIPLTKIRIPFLKPKIVDLAKMSSELKGLAGQGAETSAVKTLQKFAMSLNGSISGKMIAGSLGAVFSVFMLGSAFKKAVNAPKGEKISTFMEAFWGDFVGGFLVMFPAAKVLYKALGIKNIDKSAEQVKTMEKAVAEANLHRNYYKKVDGIVKKAEAETFGLLDNLEGKTKAELADIAKKLISAKQLEGKSEQEILKLLKDRRNGLLQEIARKLKVAENLEGKSAQEIINLLKSKKKGAADINKLIDEARKLKGFQVKFWGPEGRKLEWLIKKPISMIGRFFSTGLEMIPTKIVDSAADVGKFKSVLSRIGSFFGKFRNFSKGGFGGVLRFALVAVVLTEFARKLCVKGSHMIFGKPTKSVLDEEKPKIEDLQQQKIPMNDFIKYTSRTAIPAETATPVTPAASPVQPAVVADKKEETPGSDPKRTYVPSSVPTQFSSEVSNNNLDKALANSDKWAERAEQVIKGR
jgi:hypothetical protein